jgi:hypothetical protein
MWTDGAGNVPGIFSGQGGVYVPATASDKNGIALSGSGPIIKGPTKNATPGSSANFEQ